ncbi:phage protein [Streptococcus pneumoniae]|uniref:Phage protein n=1 Tax=Streptococcus pneumoniae TaxID=1313 RepID=A0AA86XVF8_STREE|nr:phage protein [Streptococcus pneumoniae]
MMNLDEDALICDLAETYQIYDYKQLPLNEVAVFAYGLRDDSRIKQMMSDQIVPLETTLLASIVDRLSLSLWLQTKDGQKGVNRPASIAEMLTKNNKEERDERDYLVFESGEDFENYRKALLAKTGGEE